MNEEFNNQENFEEKIENQQGTQEIRVDDVVIGSPEPTRKSGGGLKVVVALLVVAVAVFVGAVTYGALGMGKTQIEKMVVNDYLFDDFIELQKMFEKNGKTETKATSYIGKIFDALELENELGMDEVVFVSETNRKGKDVSMDYAMKIEDEEIFRIQLVRNGDVYGFNIPELTDKFFTVENKNLKKLAEKFEVDEEVIDILPNKFDEKNLVEFINNYSLLQGTGTLDSEEALTQEEVLKLFKKYEKPLMNDLKSMLEKEKGVKLEIDGEEITVTKNTIKLTNKNIAKIMDTFIRLAEDDRELYELLVKQSPEAMADIDFEEYQEEMKGLHEEIDEIRKEEIPIDMSISVYTKGNKTYAYEFTVKEDGDKVSLILQGNKTNKGTIIELILKGRVAGDKVDMKLPIRLEKVSKNEVEITIGIDAKIDTGEKITLKTDLIKAEYKHSDKADVIKIDKKSAFNINDKSIEDLEDEIENMEDAAEEYVENLRDKLPKKLDDLLFGTGGGKPTPAPSYDYYYDYGLYNW